MEDDFEIELESDQPTAGSEVPEVEEPVGDDDKQVETSEEASEVDSSDEDANDKEEENPTEAAPKESKFDKDLDEWAVKKGHEAPENDRERKLLQNLRDSDREFTKFVQQQVDPRAQDKVIVCLPDLIMAFIKGVERFTMHVKNDSALQATVFHHAAKLIIHERKNIG